MASLDTLTGLIAASVVAGVLFIGLVCFVAYVLLKRTGRSEQHDLPTQARPAKHGYTTQPRPGISYTTHTTSPRDRPALTFFTMGRNDVPTVYRSPVGYPTPGLYLHDANHNVRKSHGSTQSTVRDRESAMTRGLSINGGPPQSLFVNREMESGEERMDFEASEPEQGNGRKYESNRGRSRTRDKHKPKSKEHRSRSLSKSLDRIDKLRKSKKDDKNDSRRSRESATIKAKDGDIILQPASVKKPEESNRRPVVIPTVSSHIFSDVHVSRIPRVNGDIPVRTSPSQPQTSTITVTRTDPLPELPRQPSPVNTAFTIYKPEPEPEPDPKDTEMSLGDSYPSSAFQITPRPDYLAESSISFTQPMETPREDYNSPGPEEAEVESAFSFVQDHFTSEQDVSQPRPHTRTPTPSYDDQGADPIYGAYSYTRRIPTPPRAASPDDPTYNRITFRQPTPPPGKIIYTQVESVEVNPRDSVREKIIGRKDSSVKNAVIDELVRRRQQNGNASPPLLPSNNDRDIESASVDSSGRRAVQFTMIPPEIIPRGPEIDSPPVSAGIIPPAPPLP